eukprot:gb/GECG01012431.1/.p1 GENE.gb/GECG01012431.1/~~gb/GECG01012431.1/.p1  ORF type:complete len:839 (+),score=81.88 gb/GECG01012431.1/:1-2517(+)
MSAQRRRQMLWPMGQILWILLGILVIACHSQVLGTHEEYDLTSIVEVRRPTSIHQNHILPQFGSVQGRLQYLSELHEQHVVYWPHAIHENISSELVKPQDIVSILEMQYYGKVTDGIEHGRVLQGFRVDFSELLNRPKHVRATLSEQSSNTVRGRVIETFQDDHSLILHGVHTHHRPVAALTQAISSSVYAPVDANVYISPPGGKNALDIHTDETDVVVVQVSGRKTWHLYPAPMKLTRSSPSNPSPQTSREFRNQIETARRLYKEQQDIMGKTTPIIECQELGNSSLLPVKITLSAGDALYIPRGTPHEAVNARSSSPTGIRTVHGTLHEISNEPDDNAKQESSVHLTMSFLAGSLSFKQLFIQALYFFEDTHALSQEEREHVAKVVEDLSSDTRFEASYPRTVPVSNAYHYRHFDDLVYPLEGIHALLRSTVMYAAFAPRTYAPALFPCLAKMEIISEGEEEHLSTNLTCSTSTVGVETSLEEILFASAKQSTEDVFTLAEEAERLLLQLQKGQIRKYRTLVHGIAYQLEVTHSEGLARKFRHAFGLATDIEVYDSVAGKKGKIQEHEKDPRWHKCFRCFASESASPEVSIYELAVGIAKISLSPSIPQSRPDDEESATTQSAPDFASLFYEDGEIGRFPKSSRLSDRNPLDSLVTYPQRLKNLEENSFRRRSDTGALILPELEESGTLCGTLPYYAPQLSRSTREFTARGDVTLLSTNERQCESDGKTKRYLLHVPRQNPLGLTQVQAGIAEAALIYPPGIPFTALTICTDFLREYRIQRDSRMEYTTDMFYGDEDKCASDPLASKTLTVIQALLQTGTIGVDSGNWPEQGSRRV